MERDKLDFGNGKIRPLFMAMFFPTLIGMFFNAALNICDGRFVDHGVGSNALAAINIVAPIFLICTGIGLMFGIGASVIGGIRMAEGNVKAAMKPLNLCFNNPGLVATTTPPQSRRAFILDETSAEYTGQQSIYVRHIIINQASSKLPHSH
jgi:hypothetical protein